MGRWFWPRDIPAAADARAGFWPRDIPAAADARAGFWSLSLEDARLSSNSRLLLFGAAAFWYVLWSTTGRSSSIADRLRTEDTFVWVQLEIMGFPRLYLTTGLTYWIELNVYLRLLTKRFANIQFPKDFKQLYNTDITDSTHPNSRRNSTLA